MQYLMWRVLSGLHKTITLSFMITGHTKFSPDWCFGLLKRRYRATYVSSLKDIERVVEESSSVNICQLVGTQDGDIIVPVYDWARFLGPKFRRVDGIKKNHHFHFDSTTPGSVCMRTCSTAAEERRAILRDLGWRPIPSSLPDVIPPSGLSLERQKYLYERSVNFALRRRKILFAQSHQRTW